MMTEVPFGGLAARADDNRITLDQALYAADCFFDFDSIKGRNGYRNAITSSAAVVGSGAAQLLIRFRPTLTSARTIAVIAGTVYKITDPSSETAIDGAASSISAVFGATANISAAQLGRYLYLGTDEANVAMRRLDSSYALNSLETIPQGSKPSAGSFSSLSFTTFASLAAPTVSGCVVQTNANTGMSGLNTNWRAFTLNNNGNDDPATGAYAEYKLAANFDATSDDWVVIGITPRDTNSTNGQVDVYVETDSAGSPANQTLIGSTYDVPPIGGSPNLLFCDLRQLTPTVRAAIRYFRFVVSGSSGGKFGVYGYSFLPSKPLSNPQTYYVTFYNAATGQESPPTEALDVTIKDSDKLASGALVYPNCYLTSGNFRTDGNTGILDAGNRRVFNREAGRGGLPVLADIGALVLINGTAPTLTAGPTWTGRLWKDTDNGRRLVTTATVTTGAAYTLTDSGGFAILANTKFKPGGTPPRCSAMAARAGRLICAYENRISISSYVAPDQNSDPFPVFPAIALEDADGWSFDIAPSTAEVVQQLLNGDALYILTNECVYSMGDLKPNTIPYEVAPYGAIGRRGAIYVGGSKDGGPKADGALFWASSDGIYASRNRSEPVELTKELRRYYADTFAPDSSVVLTFQDRKLFAWMGTRYMRYDFVTGTWSAGTIAHSVSNAAVWREPTTGVQHMWLLTSDRKVQRWQKSATTDDGTAIPDWHFSTGFDRTPAPTRVGAVVIDADGPGTLLVCKTTQDTPGRRIQFYRGRDNRLGDELEFKGTADLKAWKWRVDMRAKNTTTVRYLGWERLGLDQLGG